MTQGGPGWSESLHAALSLAGNLAWVMPPPWGAAGAAATNLLGMLLPGSDDDPFQSAILGLRDYQQLSEIKEAAVYLDSYLNWMAQFQASLERLGDPDAEYIARQLRYLTDATGPNGQLFVEVARLAYLREENDAAFGVYMLAESTLVLSLKMIVQLQATLASIAEDAGDAAEFTRQTKAWVTTYVDLLIRTQGGRGATGCIEEVTSYIEGRCTARLSRIKAPYEHFRVLADGPATSGWTFKDTDPDAGDDDLTHWGTDRAAVEQAFHGYVKTITARLDTAYGPARRTLREWQAAITEWRSHAPPDPPAAPPVIGTDPRAWGGPAPAGSPWASNVKVRYAAMNVNACGPSALSSWSKYTELNGRAHPTLTLAADPQQRTLGIRVYRRFLDRSGTESPEQYVGVSTGKGILSYQDTMD